MKNSPEIYHFTDDGVVPNSKHPVLIYRKVFSLDPETGADWLEVKVIIFQIFSCWKVIFLIRFIFGLFRGCLLSKCGIQFIGLCGNGRISQNGLICSIGLWLMIIFCYVVAIVFRMLS